MDWHVMQAQPSFDGAVPGSIGNVPFSGPSVCTSQAQGRQVAHQHRMEGQVINVHHSAAYPMPDWWSCLWSCCNVVLVNQLLLLNSLCGSLILLRVSNGHMRRVIE